jgi:AAA+ ATPase superfamily predicted ATPase
MQELVLNTNEPLYGRAQEMIKLAPLHPYYLKSALGLTDSKDILNAYSVWGGIPRYWELASSYEDPALEAIERIVLDPQGILHEEPMRLLLEESPPAITLRPILDAIGLGMHKVSEIAGRLNVPSTSLGRSLERLRELGFTEREVPFGVSEENTKRTLYKIKDFFLRFWFSAVASKRSGLA